MVGEMHAAVRWCWWLALGAFALASLPSMVLGFTYGALASECNYRAVARVVKAAVVDPADERAPAPRCAFQVAWWDHAGREHAGELTSVPCAYAFVSAFGSLVVETCYTALVPERVVPIAYSRHIVSESTLRGIELALLGINACWVAAVCLAALFSLLHVLIAFVRRGWSEWNERAYRVRGYMPLQTFAVEDSDKDEYDVKGDENTARRV